MCSRASPYLSYSLRESPHLPYLSYTLRAPPYKAQEMVSRTSPLPSLDPVMLAMRQSGLGVEHGSLDPSQYNEAGSGFFVYGPPGSAQRLLVMVSGWDFQLIQIHWIFRA